MTFRYLHDCGGIHACGPAWDEFGWECVGMTEIEKFPIAVVNHHYPNLTQYGDTTKLKGSDITARIDLLVGGTPCQGFSVAGKRGGLDDPRSGLARNFLRLAAECNPRWIVWENVPGASSANEGKDLLAFAQEVGKLGYGFAWRTLDAQYFGVPQRRRRIFLVGYLGNWRPAAAVLFDPQSLRGNIAPGKKTRQGTASYSSSSIGGYSEGVGTLRAAGGDLGGWSETLVFGIGQEQREVAASLNAHGNRQDFDSENFVLDMRGNGDGKLVNTLTGDHASRPTDYTPIVFTHKDSWLANSSEVAPTMQAKNHKDSHANDSSSLAVFQHGQGAKDGTVRRLTPRECERLQGFPDDWTLIPWRKKPIEDCPDGPRYKALGNSIAVPVLRDLGRKIQIVEPLLTRRQND